MNKKSLFPVVLFCVSIFTSTGQSVGLDKFGPSGMINSGVNIHFTTGHEKDLDMIAEAGLKYIRMDFVWQNIERTKGVYDWSAYDELTVNLTKHGLKAIYILDYSNSLYENQVESKNPITGEVQKGIAAPCHPESVAAFAKWAAKAAERYKENKIVWEIWNEPNITFWQPAPDVKQYITLASATCKSIRAVTPDAIIIGPATSQVPLPFIESFLASGILEYLDGVSVHPYREYSKPPETAIEDYKKVNELIDHYVPRGKQKAPIISSEWGYASATKGLPLRTQAAYIVRTQLANLFYGIPVSIWYDWKNDGDEAGNFEHNCGTVTSDLKPKPAYIAIQTMNKELKDFALIRRVELKNENDFILLFRNESGNLKLAAWTTDQPHSVLIEKNLQEGDSSLITNQKSNNVQFKADQNRLLIDLGDEPQYTSLPSGW
jgi:polysaccharide biosynthesis protein PslG